MNYTHLLIRIYSALFFLFFFICNHTLKAQSRTVEDNKIIKRLQIELKNVKHDSIRMRLYLELGMEDNENYKTYADSVIRIGDLLLSKNPNEEDRENILRQKADAFLLLVDYYSETEDTIQMKLYYYKCLKIVLEIKDTIRIIDAMTDLGYCYSYLNTPLNAYKYFKGALVLAKYAKYKLGMANIYSGLADLFDLQKDSSAVLDNMRRSLRIYTELGDTSESANLELNIGIVYSKLHDVSNANNYFQKSIRQSELLRDTSAIVSAINAIGLTYALAGELDKASSYYNKALSYHPNKTWQASLYNNIGDLCLKQGNISDALKYIKRAQELNQHTGWKGEQSWSFEHLARIYMKQKNYGGAATNIHKAIEIAKETNNLINIRDYQKFAFHIDTTAGNNAEALQHYLQFIFYRDSIDNEELHKEATRTKFQEEYEKQKQSYKAEQMRKDELVEKELQNQKLLRNSFIGGFILVMIIAIGIFRSLQQNRKAKAIITKQKELVEEKNREILDSIEYAKRLQNAILPANKLVKEYLVDSFILYKPKDIVAGDFYWFYPVKNNDGTTTVLFAVADCTGHGVPGAMVSVVCANALNKAVKELQLSEPGKILDAVNDFVAETFTQKETNDDLVQDGMDISLCALNTDRLQLFWAGANNPLLIINPTAPKDEQVLEVKANKQPIGLYENRIPFTTHQHQLKKGEMLYLYSDGYADQFGGTDGKKLLKKNLKFHLQNISALPIEKQVAELENHFNSWKGSFAQVDDVCVIGVRV